MQRVAITRLCTEVGPIKTGGKVTLSTSDGWSREVSGLLRGDRDDFESGYIVEIPNELPITVEHDAMVSVSLRSEPK